MRDYVLMMHCARCSVSRKKRNVPTGGPSSTSLFFALPLHRFERFVAVNVVPISRGIGMVPIMTEAPRWRWNRVGITRGRVHPFLPFSLVGNNSPVLKVIVAVRRYKLNDRQNGPESRERLPRGVSNSRNADRSLPAYERDYLDSLLRVPVPLSYAYRESCPASDKIFNKICVPALLFFIFISQRNPTAPDLRVSPAPTDLAHRKRSRSVKLRAFVASSDTTRHVGSA